MNPARPLDLESLRRWMMAHGAPPSPVPKEAIATKTALDRLLPDGGFPRGAVSVLAGPSGVGRMTIAARFAAEETRSGKPIAWIDANGTLYPPALAQAGVDLERALIVRVEAKSKAVSALEQVIESGAFRVVIGCGIDEAITPARARRIVSASEGARSATLLVLGENTRMPGAQLRLKLARRAGGIQIEIERSRGGPPGGKVMLQG